MNDMKIIFATRNKGKLKEIRALLAGSDIEVVGVDEMGGIPDVTEDGKTLEENALKKARNVFPIVNDWTAAEDTGLFIDALNGEPGIHTARWPGENGNHAAYTLDRMKDIPEEKRTAHFTTVVALISPSGEEQFFEGAVEGSILTLPRGTPYDSLPYDGVFVPKEGDGRTFAEMSDEEKNRYSHRARAIQKMKEFLSHYQV